MAEYIERNEFKKYWNKEFRHLYPNDKYLVALANFPTADVVEVRHGEWLPYPSDDYMKCSVCGMEYHKTRMPDVVGYCPNPNCGAKMDGVTDTNVGKMDGKGEGE